MSDTDQILSALQSGAVPLVTGAVLVVLVALGRHPALAVQWTRVPAALPAVLYALPSPVTPGKTVVIESRADGSVTVSRES